MKKLEISNRSLAVLALFVAALWGAIFFQRALSMSAERELNPSQHSVPSTPVHTIPAGWQAPQLS